MLMLLFLLAGILLLPALAQACPNCFAAVSDGTRLDAGWFWSFLLLLAMPAAVVGSIGGWIYRTYRRAGGSWSNSTESGE